MFLSVGENTTPRILKSRLKTDVKQMNQEVYATLRIHFIAQQFFTNRHPPKEEPHAQYVEPQANFHQTLERDGTKGGKEIQSHRSYRCFAMVDSSRWHNAEALFFRGEKKEKGGFGVGGIVTDPRCLLRVALPLAVILHGALDYFLFKAPYRSTARRSASFLFKRLSVPFLLLSHGIPTFLHVAQPGLNISLKCNTNFSRFPFLFLLYSLSASRHPPRTVGLHGQDTVWA